MIASVLGLWLAGQLATVQLTPPQLASLQKGGVVLDVQRDPGGTSGSVEAVIDIPAPAALVWSTMLDCAHAKDFVPDLVSCQIISRDPAGAWEVREHIVDPGWLLPNIRSRFRADYVVDQEMRFQQVEGDFEVMEGRWDLTPIADGAATRLTYHAHLKPRMWVPDFIVQHIIESNAPDALRALRDEVLRRKG